MARSGNAAPASTRWLTVVVLSCALVAGSCTQDEPEATPVPQPIETDGDGSALRDSVIRYGLPTSPSDPWAHYRTSCDTSCGIVFGAVTDTLFATTADGEQIGLLVESFAANNDGTVHTWTLRRGIEFSDGTPLDAPAAKRNIDACRHSPLTGPDLAGIDDVRADGQVLTITSLAPWPTLPVHFAETPCGHMFSASWLASLSDLPMRTEGAPFFDPALSATPANGDPGIPVGLGPFTVESFAPGNGNSLVLEANATYWRGPDGITGETLPGADRIELVVIEDEEVRVAGLETGQFDIILGRSTTMPRPDVTDSFTSNAYADTVHLVANRLAPSGGEGEAGGVFADVSCRRAIARSIDHDALIDAIGPFAVATGPFAPRSPGFDPARTAPVFDPQAAAQWARRCLDTTTGALSIRLVTGIDDPWAPELASMIERAFTSDDNERWLEVDIVEMASGELGVAALLGDFDLLLWENHGGVHPDLEFVWWYSEAAATIGSIATNVGRFDDPALDRALVDLRRSRTRDDVVDASGEIVRAFDANRWATWIAWPEWTVSWAASVAVDLDRLDPDGNELAPIVNGVHTLAGVAMIDDGDA